MGAFIVADFLIENKSETDGINELADLRSDGNLHHLPFVIIRYTYISTE